jgi:hypothetical protein
MHRAGPVQGPLAALHLPDIKWLEITKPLEAGQRGDLGMGWSVTMTRMARVARCCDDTVSGFVRQTASCFDILKWLWELHCSSGLLITDIQELVGKRESPEEKEKLDNPRGVCHSRKALVQPLTAGLFTKENAADDNENSPGGGDDADSQNCD